MSAMDFALASIQPEAPAGRDRGDADPARAETAFPPLDLDAMESGPPAESAPSSQPAARDESPFDVSYVTGGGATDEMELTPAHGASALVSRAEPEDDATTFRFGNSLGGEDDRVVRRWRQVGEHTGGKGVMHGAKRRGAR
jgi:hypothetical protein